MKKKAILLLCACLALSACGADDGRRVAKLELIPNDAVVFQETRVDAGDAQETREDAESIEETREDARDAWEDEVAWEDEDAALDDEEILDALEEKLDNAISGTVNADTEKQDAIDGFLEDLQLVMGENASNFSTEVDGSVIYVNVSVDGVAEDVSIYLEQGAVPKEWEEIKSAYRSTSKMMSDRLRARGVDDMVVLYSAVNDANNSNTLLSASDGRIVYDVFSDDGAGNLADDTDRRHYVHP